MKKKVVVFILGVALFLMVGILICYKISTPDLISLPISKDISSIEIIDKSDTKYLETPEKIEEILKIFCDSKLTGRESVQDVPLVDDYMTIFLNLKNGEITTLYVYQENGVWFIELPYQGIYEINQSQLAVK